jgi:hypothetical protein
MALGWFLLDIKKLVDEATMSGNAGAYVHPLGPMMRPPNIGPEGLDDPEYEKLWGIHKEKKKKK